jgi:hypothetical protein
MTTVSDHPKLWPRPPSGSGLFHSVGRPSNPSDIPGASFQFGLTSIRLPRAPRALAALNSVSGSHLSEIFGRNGRVLWSILSSKFSNFPFLQQPANQRLICYRLRLVRQRRFCRLIGRRHRRRYRTWPQPHDGCRDNREHENRSIHPAAWVACAPGLHRRANNLAGNAVVTPPRQPCQPQPSP